MMLRGEAPAKAVISFDGSECVVFEHEDRVCSVCEYGALS